MPISGLTTRGNIFTLNQQTSNTQGQSAIIALKNGTFATAWWDIGSTGGDIKTMVYAADGTVIRAESVANVGTTGQQTIPAIAELVGGGFVIAWQDFVVGSGSGNDIKFRLFDASGAALGGDVLVTPSTTPVSGGAPQDVDPTVVGLANGNFAVGFAGPNGQIRAQVYGPSGAAVGGFVDVVASAGGRTPSFATDGFRIQIAYDENNNLGTGAGIYQRIATGFPTGPDVPTRLDAGAGSVSGHLNPLALFAGFGHATPLTVWANEFPLTTSPFRQLDIVYRFGATQGVVNTTTLGTQDQPGAAVLPDGGFVVVWNSLIDSSVSPTGQRIWDIRLQQFDPAGAKVGGEVLVVQTDGIAEPRVAVNAEGRVLVTWSGPGSGTDIRARLYDPVYAPGTAIGGPANDVINVGVGNQDAYGFGGIDTAVYTGSHSQYQIDTDTVTQVRDSVAGRDGLDSLSGIERLRFSDGVLAVDINLPGGGPSNAGSAYRLYEAAFNRTPDNDGLAFWIKNLDAGLTPLQAAGFFLQAPEFLATYGANPTAAQLVGTFYTNILGRAPEQAGFDFWFNILNGRPDQTAVVLNGIANSIENQNGLVATIGQGVFLPGSLLF